MTPEQSPSTDVTLVPPFQSFGRAPLLAFWYGYRYTRLSDSPRPLHHLLGQLSQSPKSAHCCFSQQPLLPSYLVEKQFYLAVEKMNHSPKHQLYAFLLPVPHILVIDVTVAAMRIRSTHLLARHVVVPSHHCLSCRHRTRFISLY